MFGINLNLNKGCDCVLIFALNAKCKDECVRRNAKLVPNHLISDTCLNALKWPRGAINTPWLIRNSGPWPTWVNKRLAKQWPPIILQPAPSSTQTHRAPTPHVETKSELLSDRQQQGHMEGGHTQSGITVTRIRRIHTLYSVCIFTCTGSQKRWRSSCIKNLNLDVLCWSITLHCKDKSFCRILELEKENSKSDNRSTHTGWERN